MILFDAQRAAFLTAGPHHSHGQTSTCVCKVCRAVHFRLTRLHTQSYERENAGTAKLLQ